MPIQETGCARSFLRARGVRARGVRPGYWLIPAEKPVTRSDPDPGLAGVRARRRAAGHLLCNAWVRR